MCSVFSFSFKTQFNHTATIELRIHKKQGWLRRNFQVEIISLICTPMKRKKRDLRNILRLTIKDEGVDPYAGNLFK